MLPEHLSNTRELPKAVIEILETLWGQYEYRRFHWGRELWEHFPELIDCSCEGDLYRTLEVLATRGLLLPHSYQRDPSKPEWINAYRLPRPAECVRQSAVLRLAAQVQKQTREQEEALARRTLDF